MEKLANIITNHKNTAVIAIRDTLLEHGHRNAVSFRDGAYRIYPTLAIGARLHKHIKNGEAVSVTVYTPQGKAVFDSYQFHGDVFLILMTFNGIDVNRDARKLDEYLQKIN